MSTPKQENKSEKLILELESNLFYTGGLRVTCFNNCCSSPYVSQATDLTVFNSSERQNLLEEARRSHPKAGLAVCKITNSYEIYPI